MARQQSHRGPAAQDAELFAPRQLASLRAATRDLCWLLDHGYAVRSATELVGNRYRLTGRQRLAVGRCVCSEESVTRRRRTQVGAEALRARELWLDGYNVLTVLESALSGGVVLVGRDGCCRDIAGIHRRYRRVNETLPVLRLIGEAATAWGAGPCRWWLDTPVSNSGRLRTLILDLAKGQGWNMTVELVFNPDRILSASEEVIATSDGVVLDRCQQWVNFARLLIAERIPQAHVLELHMT